MNLALFYDTETSGLPLFSQPSEHPDQPHIVQLGAALVDLDTRKVRASLDVIIRPDGWTIPAVTSAIHGITTEMAMDLGVPAAHAIDMFLELWAQGSRVRIGHNESFDARILRIALMRHVDPRDRDLAIPVSDEWKAGRAECTQRLATPFVKAPPSAKMLAVGRNHIKSANLGEAYQHFTGKPLEDAHSAMADVLGCMAVWFGIQDHQRAAAEVA